MKNKQRILQQEAYKIIEEKLVFLHKERFVHFLCFLLVWWNFHLFFIIFTSASKFEKNEKNGTPKIFWLSLFKKKKKIGE